MMMQASNLTQLMNINFESGSSLSGEIENRQN